jgi:NTP pyrophosphatase (non-canonical NTP hydrolase)
MLDTGISANEYSAVADENLRQVAKWGYQDVSPYEWLCYLTEEVGELAQAINKVYSEHDKLGVDKMDIYKEAIQVATLAMKIANMDREVREEEVVDE